MSAAAESREDRQRNRILDAAARCFARDGFKGATIEDIASAASLSRPILYKHFEGKDALIDAVLEATFDAWHASNARFADVADLESKASRLKSSSWAKTSFSSLVRVMSHSHKNTPHE